MSYERESAALATETDAMEKHRIPAIDRMMDVLGHLEKRPGGTTTRELVEVLHVPRTTIYRLLNSLHSYGLVKRTDENTYVLGTRLISLAARVLPSAADVDLVLLATPHLERLSEFTGEGCKLTVLDEGAAVVIAALAGTHERALMGVQGQRLPLHAGAASKMLLAGLTKSELDAVLPESLARYTPQTITDLKELRAELTRIRRQGFAWDEGEFSQGVNAFAAPVPGRNGRTVAALSVPFLAGAETDRRELIRAATISAAGAIAADIPATPKIALAERDG